MSDSSLTEVSTWVDEAASLVRELHQRLNKAEKEIERLRAAQQARAALGQSSFCLRTVTPLDADAVMTNNMILDALRALDEVLGEQK